ncbi:MAG: polyprenyl synthetase family protein [Candidatus Nanohalobium sp.]
MEDKKVKQELAGYVPLEKVEKILAETVDRTGADIEVLNTVEEYCSRLITGDGKRFRVAVPYIMAKGLDIDLSEEELLKVLIPLEVIHGLSLIQDDVMDQDQVRRGLETPHEKFKSIGFSRRQAESLATLDVMHLQSIVQRSVLKLDIQHEKKMEVAEILDRVLEDISRGQMLDIAGESIYRGEKFREMLSGKDESFEYLKFYEEVVARKTTPLIKAGPRILEVISGKELGNLKKYAEQLGKAFQVRDDILDITGGEEEIGAGEGLEQEIGKDRFSDLLEGTVTLPVYYAIQELQDGFTKNREFIEGLDKDSGREELETEYGSSRKFLKHVLRKKEPEAWELKLAGKMVESSDALKRAEDEARGYAEEAAGELEASPVNGKEKMLLEQLAYFAATRSK